MTTKPETTMSAEVEEMNVEVAIGSVLGWFADDSSLPRDIRVALTKLVKTSRKHLSCPQTAADLVAALIAEGGEIVRWCETHVAESIENQGGLSDECWRVVWADHSGPQGVGFPYELCRITERLVFPVPVDVEKET